MFQRNEWKVVWHGIEYNVEVIERLEGIDILRRNNDPYYIVMSENPIPEIKIKELGLKYRYAYFIFSCQEDEHEPYLLIAYKNKNILALDTPWNSFMDVLKNLHENIELELEKETIEH
jgi:hypothetical protein